MNPQIGEALAEGLTFLHFDYRGAVELPEHIEIPRHVDYTTAQGYVV